MFEPSDFPEGPGANDLPDKWMMRPLFSLDQRDHIRIWHIYYDTETNQLTTVSGILVTRSDVDPDDFMSKCNKLFTDMAKDYNLVKKSSAVYKDLYDRYSSFIKSPVDIVAKQKRNNTQQAWLQACKKYSDKMAAGATPTVSDLFVTKEDNNDNNNATDDNAQDDSDGPISKFNYEAFRPQLAVKYEIDEEKSVLDARATLKKEQFEVGVVSQVKEDGERGVVYRDPQGDSIVIMSRTGKPNLWLDYQRVQMGLLLKYLPKGCILDGELTHIEGRATAQGILSKKKHKSPRDNEIIYNIFDIYIPDMVLEDRIKVLDDAFKEYTTDVQFINGVINRIENHVFHSFEELYGFFEEVVAQGKEGIVIRRLAGPNKKFAKFSVYKVKRNKNLLKAKPIMDMEGTVVGITPGTGKFKNCAIFELELENGVRFSCCSHGDLKSREKYLLKPKKYIGQTYTFRYDGLSDDGVPIDPRGIAFREDL